MSVVAEVTTAELRTMAERHAESAAGFIAASRELSGAQAEYAADTAREMLMRSEWALLAAAVCERLDRAVEALQRVGMALGVRQ